MALSGALSATCGDALAINSVLTVIAYSRKAAGVEQMSIDPPDMPNVMKPISFGGVSLSGTYCDLY